MGKSFRHAFVKLTIVIIARGVKPFIFDELLVYSESGVRHCLVRAKPFAVRGPRFCFRVRPTLGLLRLGLLTLSLLSLHRGSLGFCVALRLCRPVRLDCQPCYFALRLYDLGAVSNLNSVLQVVFCGLKLTLNATTELVYITAV